MVSTKLVAYSEGYCELGGGPKHFRGHAGHEVTRDEPLRVGAQIIADARDGVAFAA